MIPKELTNRINIYNMSTRQEIKNRLLLSLGNKVFNECKVNSDIDWMFEAYDIIPKSAHASMEIRPSLSLENIEKCILAYYKLPKADFKSKSRQQHIVWARQIFAYIAREAISPRYTTTEIGNYLNQDHCTILHSVNKAVNMLETETQKRIELHHLRSIIMEIVNKEGEYKPKRGLNDKEITPRTESLPDINTSNEPLPDDSDEQGDLEEHY